MSFISALNISGSGMTAQRFRLDIVSENIANMGTTRTESGEPYRRKTVVFESTGNSFYNVFNEVARSGETPGVKVTEIVEDDSQLQAVFDPTHPDADEEGYIYLPNIDSVKEVADAMAATNAYSANVTAFNALKLMMQKALEVGK